jgi:hypothetical protein
MATPTDQPTRVSPDIQKLAGMGARTVNITKLLARGGQPIWLAKKGVSVDMISEMQSTLPTLYGPGMYLFEVFDDTDPRQKEVWTAKLGGAAAEPTMEGSMSGAPGSDGVAGDGSTDLGFGFKYNEKFGILTTRTGQIVQWRQGDSWPASLGGPGAAPMGMPGMPGVSMPGMPGMPAANTGWGSMPAAPVEDETRRELREMKAKFADRDREDAHKAEIGRLEKAIAEQSATQNAALTAALAKIGEKPTGPSPEVEALKGQLEELKRQNAEQKATAEATRREDAIRDEIKAQGDRFERLVGEIRAAAAVPKGPDPSLTMVTELIRGQQTATTATVDAMKAAAHEQAEAAKETARIFADRLGGSVLTPEKMMEMLKVAKDRSFDAEANKAQIEMFKSTFNMAQDVLRLQNEAMGAQNGPAWVGPVQQGLDQLGSIARSVASARAGGEMKVEAEKARIEAAKAEADASRARAAEITARSNAAAIQRGLTPQQAAIRGGAAPGPAASREPTAAEIRDQAAAAMGITPRPTPSDAAAAQTPAVQPQPAGNNGAAGPAQPATVTPISTARRARPAAPPAGATPVDLRTLTPDQLRPHLQINYTDEALFGPAFPQVEQLRAGMPVDPDEVANGIIMTQQYYSSYGGPVPPCVELLNADHVKLLVERLIPGGDPGYLSKVEDAIRVQLRAEAVGGGSDTGTNADA